VIYGRLEGWKGGRVEGWKDGGMEEWKVGRVEGWKDGRMEEWKLEEWKVISFGLAIFHSSILPSFHPSTFL
jgi:hypothetical protein